ncbi:hypothetical protein JCM4814A_03140 [Streptomyces phaeofaciens JCM 4814]|uniref:Uncharacterized protein n=1 Tax=Streptomyces phaeofaciens TaxID=68254 RepID=A0A918M1P3_9ACTN|nr:hypothetical protein GCM10010226_89650 [Streptomyces phaeofaciens]
MLTLGDRSAGKLPAASPGGQAAVAELAQQTLTGLCEAKRRSGADSGVRTAVCPAAARAAHGGAGRRTRCGRGPARGQRLGYLDGQMMRAVRLIIDIGMHLELEISVHAPFHPGSPWSSSPDTAAGRRS